MIEECCASVDKWLSDSPDNVVAIHCKAGKGRTGLIVSSYLLYSEFSSSATEALKYYGETRTKNGKGVTIP
jgi:phosphatidylinositol-3,4,5-trisphosphate 3-phosphatase/dual-specificity protein phosphatase PTEN